ncbi:hypothetical protein CDAR_380221 [Caerostris darwini]|uniref:Uncharacterized protein n=1 Tax=Caerostris darwini TaxID=1538125 RepID=A0AAV4TH32_9ARAC|nr:hypothetical protein CDAR_380221 [Caerostris darwini]
MASPLSCWISSSLSCWISSSYPAGFPLAYPAGFPLPYPAESFPPDSVGLPPPDNAGFRPLSTAEVHSKATRSTVKKDLLKILQDLTSVYNETCRLKTRLSALLQGDIVELVERIHQYFFYMQEKLEKLEKFLYFYTAFYIEVSHMHTTPGTQQEIDSIRITCSTRLIRVKNILLSCQTAWKIFEMFNNEYVRTYINKVYEISAEVVHVMGEEVTRMRTVISSDL